MMEKHLPKDAVTVSKGSKPQKIKAKKGKMIRVTRSEGFVEVTTNDKDLIKKLKEEGYT